MDYYYNDSSTINITNGIIEDIDFVAPDTLATVSYTDRRLGTQNRQRIRLVISKRTLIIDESGNEEIPARNLSVGMAIDAVVSSSVTRSIPPQANALVIQVMRRPNRPNTPGRPGGPGRPMPSDITIGRILDIDRERRRLTTISDGNLSSIISFNVPQNTVILSRNGIPINFDRLIPGLRVRVRHATFMTASIPPQTTAFEVRVL